MECYGTVRYGTVRYGTVRYGTVRYGTVRYGTVRYGTVRYGNVPHQLRNYSFCNISLQPILAADYISTAGRLTC